HAGAGGGTIRAGQWDAFKAAFAHTIIDQATNAPDHLIEVIDGVLGLACMHIGLAERLARFEPLGRGNPACQWLIQDIQIADRRDLKGGVTRLKLTDGSRWLDGIVFGANGMGDAIEPGLTVSIIGQLQKDDWRGNGAVQFVVADVVSDY
ncbi:MAG: single-stranded-DNA-specific exonuclease RecJ, partial [Mariprofundus sp.]|nr:single-stranded-DNA-specific exonuclease RecJ [Mariprofundus sp.]